MLTRANLNRPFKENDKTAHAINWHNISKYFLVFLYYKKLFLIYKYFFFIFNYLINTLFFIQNRTLDETIK